MVYNGLNIRNVRVWKILTHGKAANPNTYSK